MKWYVVLQASLITTHTANVPLNPGRYLSSSQVGVIGGRRRWGRFLNWGLNIFLYCRVQTVVNMWRRKLVNTATKREVPRNIVRTANIPRLMSGFSAFEESTIFSPRCTLTAVGRFNCTLNMEIILTNSLFCVGKEDFQHLILIIFATSSRWYIRSENIQFLIGEGFTKLMFDV